MAHRSCRYHQYSVRSHGIAHPGHARATVTARAGGPSRRLDSAVRTINSLISLGDMFGSTGSPPPQLPTPETEGSEDTAEGRWVRISTSSRSSCSVIESFDASLRRRTIGDYLLLPVEAYNLLDPTWIRRALEFSATAITSGAETALTQSNGTDLMVDAPVSAHSSPIEHPESTVPPTMSVAQQQRARSNMGGTEPQSSKIGVNNASAGLLNAIDRLGSRADDAFVLTVPVEELTGLPVRPRVLVTVEGDRGTGGVLFRSAYVEFGSNVLDNRVKIDLRAHLFRRDRRRPLKGLRARARGMLGRGGRATSETDTADSDTPAPWDSDDTDVPLARASAVESSRGGGASASEASGSGRAAAEAGDSAAPSVSTSTASSTGTSAGAGAMAAASSSLASRSAGEEEEGAEDLETEGVEALLSSRMALRIEVMVPPPYSRIPGPFLAGATRVILDAVIAQLYPRFLELLAQDYRTWARGDARNAQEGELIGAGTAQE